MKPKDTLSIAAALAFWGGVAFSASPGEIPKTRGSPTMMPTVIWDIPVNPKEEIKKKIYTPGWRVVPVPNLPATPKSAKKKPHKHKHKHCKTRKG